MSPPVESLAARLGARRVGREWRTLCPLHDDDHPSLDFREGNAGIVFTCRSAGCDSKAIAWHFRAAHPDLFQHEPVAQGPRVVRTTRHEIRDAAGALVAVHVRRDLDDGSKRFAWAQPDGSAGLNGTPVAALPLYGSERLAKLKPEAGVLVTEGEKACEAVRGLKLPAVGTVTGAAGCPGSEALAVLCDRRVFLWPDADEPGRAHMDRVGRALAGVASEVRIVAWGEPRFGDDAADFVARGGTRDGLLALAKAAPRWEQRQVPHASGDSGDGDETPRKPGKTEVSSPPPWRPFPVGHLPEPIRGCVANAAETLGCCASYVALPLLAGLASAIGNAFRVVLKDGWTEPAIIWAVVVGESGTLKSPAIELALRPIRARQHEAMKRHAEDIARHELELATWERAHAEWKRSKSTDPPPERPDRPAAARCWSDDVTIEALAGLLEQNPRGLLVARDELAGWLDFDRYQGNGGDCARWLECFGGRPLLVDRKTTGTTYVPQASVSVTGGIQPGTLRRALGEKHRQDGLLARLLLAAPPRGRKRWTETDLAPRHAEALDGVFAALYQFEPDADHDGNERPRLVRLDPTAKVAWVGFYNEQAEEQADLTGDLAAAWSKLEGYAARLALVVHLVRWVAVGNATRGDIHVMDAASVEAGVALSRWFAGEAARVYAILAEDADQRDRRGLVEWIGARGGSVTGRDLTRGRRRFRNDPQGAEAALSDLVEAGLAEWCWPASPQGGRPARVCRLVRLATDDETPDFPKNPEVSSPSPVSPPDNAKAAELLL